MTFGRGVEYGSNVTASSPAARRRTRYLRLARKRKSSRRSRRLQMREACLGYGAVLARAGQRSRQRPLRWSMPAGLRRALDAGDPDGRPAFKWRVWYSRLIFSRGTVSPCRLMSSPSTSTSRLHPQAHHQIDDLQDDEGGDAAIDEGVEHAFELDQHLGEIAVRQPALAQRG